jgi:hypothetical protein
MAEISKQALKVANNTDFPNNSTGYITPELLRGFNTDMIDSTVNQAEYTINSGSWNNSISQLNSFTSSQQPAFNSLNAFTASQLNVNSGVNAFTWSADARLDALEIDTNNLEQWTSSINEIRFNGGTPQYSTRLSFGGFISASFVPNVNGLIADINVLNDPSKLNTSSFNAYTASTAATQSVFSASVANSISASTNAFTIFSGSQNTFNTSATASIVQLLDFSSSLDATFATDAQLAAVSSSLKNTIDTKLNTSSFNDYTASTQSSLNSLVDSVATKLNTSSFNAYTASLGSLESLNLFTASANLYTASNNQKWETIGLLTGSYATTGSNVFSGSQIITGSYTLTGSAYGNVISASITSNTASIDLSKANYFTLTIASNTNINVTNVQPGVTATLVINTAGATTASFSSNVKQSSGSLYVPSISGNIDILSFTAVTPSTVFVVPAYTFV